MLDVWLNGAEHVVQVDTPGLNGCITMAVVANYYWKIRINHSEAGYRWVGQTRWVYAHAWRCLQTRHPADLLREDLAF